MSNDMDQIAETHFQSAILFQTKRNPSYFRSPQKRIISLQKLYPFSIISNIYIRSQDNLPFTLQFSFCHIIFLLLHQKTQSISASPGSLRYLAGCFTIHMKPLWFFRLNRHTFTGMLRNLSKQEMLFNINQCHCQQKLPF